jgi:hypothetical protein
MVSFNTPALPLTTPAPLLTVKQFLSLLAPGGQPTLSAQGLLSGAGGRGPFSFEDLISDFEQRKKVGVVGVQFRSADLILQGNISTFVDLQNAWPNGPGPTASDFEAVRTYLDSFGVSLKLVSADLRSGALFGSLGALASVPGVTIDDAVILSIVGQPVQQGPTAGDYGAAAGAVGTALAGAGAVLLQFATQGPIYFIGSALAGAGVVFLVIAAGFLVWVVVEKLNEAGQPVSDSSDDIDVGDGDLTVAEATVYGDLPEGVDVAQLVEQLVIDPNQIDDGWDNGGPIDLGLDGEGSSLPGGNPPSGLGWWFG